METSLFEPESLPPELSGVTARLLADLYDVVAKFGADVNGVAIRRLCVNATKAIYVTVVVPPSPMRSMMISRMPGNINEHDCHRFLLKDGRASWVRWDKLFSIEDINAFIAAVDAEMRAAGCVASDGTRLRRASERFSDWKMPIDRVFVRRGRVIEPGNIDAESLRRQFDRPDDIAVITDAAGRQLLCRAADVGYIELRSQLAKEVLRRHGVSSPADLQNLPPKERAAIAAAIAKVLSAIDN